jgi:GPH family glycoside/pentoside/hexuronide:cation symporter
MAAPAIKPMMVFNVLYGAGNGLVKGLSFILIADLVTYTERITGQFAPGTGNAGISATEKLGAGLGNTIFGFALAAAGFNAALDAQPASVDTMISALFIWIPVLLFIIILVIFMLFFDLERKMNEN